MDATEAAAAHIFPVRFPRELPSPVPPHPGDAALTHERAWKYRQVLARRTRRLTVVIEDCCDPHNATAVVRTCDAFGLARVCVIAARNGFKINRQVSQGSHYYVAIETFPDIAACYAALRRDGAAIYATDLSAAAVVGPERLAPVLARQPLALVFGNEGDGLSPAAAAGADGQVLIPMRGFPQSLNLSVSVAICLYALRAPALCDDAPGDLSAAEQCALYDAWVTDHAPQAVAQLVARATGKRGEELDVWPSARRQP